MKSLTEFIKCLHEIRLRSGNRSGLDSQASAEMTVWLTRWIGSVVEFSDYCRLYLGEFQAFFSEGGNRLGPETVGLTECSAGAASNF